MTTLNRRQAIGAMLASMTAPMVFRQYATAAPSMTLNHASFGADGMAGSDIGSLSGSKNFKLVAVAEVDESRLANVKKRWPDVRVYADWRILLDKEKDLNSVNVSTPDHMHAPITMRAMQQGLHVYTQKPLTQTIYEARQLTKVAKDKKIVSQMGIQIHSHEVHKTVVLMIHAGLIGKVKEVHSWSGKKWGDTGPRPTRKDPIPAALNWDLWLGVAAERPFIGGGYYHPGNWRKRLDFGTGTFGDMGCHILDPVFGSTAFGNPLSVECLEGTPTEESWNLENVVRYVFPATAHAVEGATLTWYNGERRPPAEVIKLLEKHKLSDQGSIYIGEKGVLYSPYIAAPILLPEEKFKEVARPKATGDNHYLQFIQACLGEGKTSAPFEYAGPLTEGVLLGCLATRFPGKKLEWDSATMKVTNNAEASKLVRREYRKGWEVEGL